MKCGRQPGGENVNEHGLCPAATNNTYDGVNYGKNGGRFCWVVAGTFCRGQVQGTFAQKLINCVNCEFFKMVQDEESNCFVFTLNGPDKVLNRQS
jgi:hypothetical protein